MKIKILSDWDDHLLEQQVEDFLNNVSPYYDIHDIELTTQHRTKVLISYGQQTNTSTGLPEEKNVIKYFFCDTNAQIGDVVRMSTTISNKVIVTTDNKHPIISIGIITDKITPTIAQILIQGSCTLDFPGLVLGERIFHSKTGSLTTTIPDNGYIHIIGFCYETNKIYVKPSMDRIGRGTF